jgi:hypothetical protein
MLQLRQLQVLHQTLSIFYPQTLLIAKVCRSSSNNSNTSNNNSTTSNNNSNNNNNNKLEWKKNNKERIEKHLTDLIQGQMNLQLSVFSLNSLPTSECLKMPFKCFFF